MRKFTFLMLSFLVLGFSAVEVEAVNVTFQVDMNVQILNGNFDAATQVVRAAGSFQNWSPADAPDMLDADEDGIYEGTYDIAEGDYLFKYVIGTDWGNNENDPNRTLSVGAADTVLPVVYYNGVSAFSFPTPAEGKVNVMFTVNMTRQRQVGNFNPDVDIVRFTGSLTDPQWDPATGPVMEDTDGNLVYTHIFEVDTNATNTYKFLIGDTWGRDETSGDRSLTTGTGNMALDPVYFSNEPYDPDFVADSVNVTFQLNMKVKIEEGLFDPLTEAVHAVGSFQGWSPSTAPDMDDTDGDSIYVYTHRMPGNLEYKYKYIIGTTDGGYENISDRVLNLGSTDTTLAPVYFNNDDVVSQITDGNITFNVKMDVMTEVGIYDPSVDSIQVRGSFNGWNDGDKDKSLMNQNIIDPNNWFLQVEFLQKAVDDKEDYKFFVKPADPNTMWTDGWERPALTGGGNRSVFFAGTSDQNTGDLYFDSVLPDYVIEDGNNISVTFSVDMTPATDPNLQAIPFNAALDTVYWISEQPSFVMTQGWVDKNDMRVLKLTDENADMIYTATLNLQTPTFNTFVYRYAWRNSTGEWVYEPEGYSNFAYRVRYVGQDAARSFPTPSWGMPVDTWTNKEVKTDQETDAYSSYTSVEDEIGSIPNQYVLNQNYPNPFNPVTTITYTLAKSGKVKLDIYNVLGQKVRTLIDGNATAGLHVDQWNGLDNNGKKVASGVYFYKLEAGEFTAIKKMIMIK